MNDEPNEPDTGFQSRRPVNVGAPSTEDDTGFLIVELREGALQSYERDLGTAAVASGLNQMHATLNAFNISAQPLIKALPLEEVRVVSTPLQNYWRVDVRQSRDQLEQIEQAINQLPEVKQVYREKTVTEAVNPADDDFAQFQTYLGVDGVNATPLWDLLRPGSTGLRFIDLEQAWIRDHEDLPVTTVIYNNNRDGHDGVVGDHGSAAVAVVAAVDNDRGVVGIEPNPGSVRLVSCWNRLTGDLIVSDAIVAAMTSQPRPDVLLIEMQGGGTSCLPVEVDPPTFTAIREATASGIIVVEPAGNGNRNLNGILNGQDSGAIMVGAADAQPPHNRGLWADGQGSNFGARVDCYAWGNGITTAGFGGLQTLGATRNYTNNFGGTSGAAAIIAGCVMLLQRLRIERTGIPLTPAEMRALLSNAATGTAQGGAVAGHIGVMPNLQAIVNSRPDLFPEILPEMELSGTLGFMPARKP
jgi:hypothetical protein